MGRDANQALGPARAAGEAGIGIGGCSSSSASTHGYGDYAGAYGGEGNGYAYAGAAEPSSWDALRACRAGTSVACGTALRF